MGGLRLRELTLVDDPLYRDHQCRANLQVLRLLLTESQV
jgi:hypothetical protein